MWNIFFSLQVRRRAWNLEISSRSEEGRGENWDKSIFLSVRVEWRLMRPNFLGSVRRRWWRRRRRRRVHFYYVSYGHKKGWFFSTLGTPRGWKKKKEEEEERGFGIFTPFPYLHFTDCSSGSGAVLPGGLFHSLVWMQISVYIGTLVDYKILVTTAYFYGFLKPGFISTVNCWLL